MNSETPENQNPRNSTVIKLGFVSLFADISSEMLYPITPIFLTTILGASMTSVGFIEGFAEGLGSLLKIFSALWSDRLSKRKPFLIGGYFLSAIGKPFMGFATSWIHIVLARSIDRVGKGIRGAPRDALLAEAVLPKYRGAAFGWHRSMDTLGALLGPLFAILYLTYFNDNLRSIYYWALLPGLIAVIFIFSVKEKPISASPLPKKISLQLNWKSLPKEYKIYLLSWGVFSLTNSSDVFLLLKAKQQGISMNGVIFMYCFYNLIYALLSPYLGKLSDKFPRKNIMIFGLIVFSLVYLGFSFATLAWHLWILFGLYGLYMAATDGVSKALAIDLIEQKNPALKASSLGVLGTVTGLSTILASTIAGSLWDSVGAQWTFLYGAIGAVICAILFSLFLSSKKIYTS